MSTENSNPGASTPCLDCGGTGFIGSPEGFRECAHLVVSRMHREVPRLYWEARVRDFPEPIQQFVSGWQNEPRSGLAIFGAVGRGKTHLAAALARRLILSRKFALFLRCSELYLQAREAYRKGQTEESVLREYGCPFLVIDDIGAGSLSDFERRILLEILERREIAMQTTVVTTNWTIGEIADRMDQRIADRIARFDSLKLEGPSRRIRNER